MVFEFIGMQRVVGESEYGSDISVIAKKRFDDAGVMLGGLFILPGYICGIVIGLRTLGE
jgi:hypothetical protein